MELCGLVGQVPRWDISVIIKIYASDQISWNMLWEELCGMMVFWYFLVWAKIYIGFSSQIRLFQKVM